MSATQTPEVARSDVYTDAELFKAALRRLADMERQMVRIHAHACIMAGRAAGTKGLEQGFTTLAAMAEEGLRNA